MQHQLIITLDDKVSEEYAMNFLRNVNFIKSIKLKGKRSIPDVDEVSLMSESALAEDWLSEEDSRWDEVL